MTTSTTTAESEAFLAAVREQLSDLPEEERTDLSGGPGPAPGRHHRRPGRGRPVPDHAAGRAGAVRRRTSGRGRPSSPDRADGHQGVVHGPVRPVGPARLSQKLWRRREVMKVEGVRSPAPAGVVGTAGLPGDSPSGTGEPQPHRRLPHSRHRRKQLPGVFLRGRSGRRLGVAGDAPRRQVAAALIIAGNALLVMFTLGMLSEVDYRMNPGNPVRRRFGARRPLPAELAPRAGDQHLSLLRRRHALKECCSTTRTAGRCAPRCSSGGLTGANGRSAVPRAADGVGVELSYPKNYVLTGDNGGLPCNVEGYNPKVMLPSFAESAGGGAG